MESSSNSEEWISVRVSMPAKWKSSLEKIMAAYGYKTVNEIIRDIIRAYLRLHGEEGV